MPRTRGPGRAWNPMFPGGLSTNSRSILKGRSESLVTIVKHKTTGKNYVLIGTGYGMFKTVRPSMWGGNLSPQLQDGHKTLVAVADKKGTIKWIESDRLQVVEMDGKSLKDIYAEIPLDDC